MAHLAAFQSLNTVSWNLGSGSRLSGGVVDWRESQTEDVEKITGVFLKYKAFRDVETDVTSIHHGNLRPLFFTLPLRWDEVRSNFYSSSLVGRDALDYRGGVDTVDL